MLATISGLPTSLNQLSKVMGRMPAFWRLIRAEQWQAQFHHLEGMRDAARKPAAMEKQKIAEQRALFMKRWTQVCWFQPRAML